MHTSDPIGSEKCPRRDTDDVICELGSEGSAVTATWKANGTLQRANGNGAGF